MDVIEVKNTDQPLQERIEKLAERSVILAADINSRIYAPTENTEGAKDSSDVGEGNRSPAFIKKTRLSHELGHLIKEAGVPVHKRMDRFNHELSEAANRLEKDNPGIKKAYETWRKNGLSL